MPRREGPFAGIKTGAATTDYRAEPMRLTRGELTRVGIPTPLQGVRLRDVSTPAKESLERYVGRGKSEDLKERLAEGVGLWIHGQAGVGKSSVAAIVARRARAWRFRVHMVGVSVWREARRGGVVYDVDLDQSVVDRCIEVDLLVLDGLTASDLEDRYHGEEALLSLLRARSEARKATLVTTSLPLTHPFAQRVIRGVQGLVPLEVSGSNRIYDHNRGLYGRLFGK